MPLQIMIATLLALVILGGITKAGGGRPDQTTVIGNSDLEARVLKNSHASNVVVIKQAQRPEFRIFTLSTPSFSHEF